MLDIRLQRLELVSTRLIGLQVLGNLTKKNRQTSPLRLVAKKVGKIMRMLAQEPATLPMLES